MGATGSTGPSGLSTPIIQSLSSSDLPALPGATVQIFAIVQSPNGLPLTYTWSIPFGSGWTIVGGDTTPAVQLRADTRYASKGTARLSVLDTNGQVADAEIGLSTLADLSPSIQSIAVSPQPVLTQVNLKVSATHPYGVPVDVSWTIGGIAGLATGADASWTSPGIPGQYLASANVTAIGGSLSATASMPMTVSSSSPWPKFRRDRQGTSRSTASAAGPATGAIVWSLKLETTTTPPPTLYSSPAVAEDGTIYVGSGLNVYAINPDGTQRWALPFATSGQVRSSPAIAADGTVYVGSDDGNLYAINRDGTQTWALNLGGPISSSPTIGADGTVYVGVEAVGAGFASLVAIDPRGTGTIKWFYLGFGGFTSSPALAADGTIYVATVNGVLVAISPDGQSKWEFPLLGSVRASPTVGSDGTVYVTRTDGQLFAVSPSGGQRWSIATSPGAPVTKTYSSPVLSADGTIYQLVGSKLLAISPDGSQVSILSSGLPGEFAFSTPALGADGTVYVAWPDGVRAVTATNPAPKWLQPTAIGIYSSPAIGADGTVYVVDDNGFLRALR